MYRISRPWHWSERAARVQASWLRSSAFYPGPMNAQVFLVALAVILLFKNAKTPGAFLRHEVGGQGLRGGGLGGRLPGRRPERGPQSSAGPCLIHESNEIPIRYRRNSLQRHLCAGAEFPKALEDIVFTDMNRVELTSSLKRVGDSWEQIDENCFARRSHGRRFINIWMSFRERVLNTGPLW